MDNANVFSSLKKPDFYYAFYFLRAGESPIHSGNNERFPAASIIKVPILLAWVHLERCGEVDRLDSCNLDHLPQVQGSGFARLLSGRHIPYQDALLMMMAVSDNLCTNLIIERIGIQRLNTVFEHEFGLEGTRVERKLMDFEARDRGLDNWITARDCERYYDLFEQLNQPEKAWVEPMLLANQDDSLLKRNLPRDTVDFYHKTGSMSGVLHDWGYTRDCRLFLLTSNVQDEPVAFEYFGKAGALLAQDPTRD
jgi:beta-lactamase class A